MNIQSICTVRPLYSCTELPSARNEWVLESVLLRTWTDEEPTTRCTTDKGGRQNDLKLASHHHAAQQKEPGSTSTGPAQGMALPSASVDTLDSGLGSYSSCPLLLSSTLSELAPVTCHCKYCKAGWQLRASPKKEALQSQRAQLPALRQKKEGRMGEKKKPPFFLVRPHRQGTTFTLKRFSLHNTKFYHSIII